MRVPAEALSFADAPEAEARVLARDVEAGKCIVYTYIPLEASANPPSEDFPICQTWVLLASLGCAEHALFICLQVLFYQYQYVQ